MIVFTHENKEQQRKPVPIQGLTAVVEGEEPIEDVPHHGNDVPDPQSIDVPAIPGIDAPPAVSMGPVASVQSGPADTVSDQDEPPVDAPSDRGLASEAVDALQKKVYEAEVVAGRYIFPPCLNWAFMCCARYRRSVLRPRYKFLRPASTLCQLSF
jgi:hypothetical protein